MRRSSAQQRHSRQVTWVSSTRLERTPGTPAQGLARPATWQHVSTAVVVPRATPPWPLALFKLGTPCKGHPPAQSRLAGTSGCTHTRPSRRGAPRCCEAGGRPAPASAPCTCRTLAGGEGARPAHAREWRPAREQMPARQPLPFTNVCSPTDFCRSARCKAVPSLGSAVLARQGSATTSQPGRRLPRPAWCCLPAPASRGCTAYSSAQNSSWSSALKGPSTSSSEGLQG